MDAAPSLQVIDSFRFAHGFLSNFSAARVVLDGMAYPTVEHAFQAAKASVDQRVQIWQHGKLVSLRWRVHIQLAKTPGEAKKLGRQVPLRDDWGLIRVGVMRDLLYQKFAPGRIHLTLLLQTGDALLIEGNTWRDTYWGVCEGKGTNMLGQLLMEVRAVRRSEGLDAMRDPRQTEPGQ